MRDRPEFDSTRSDDAVLTEAEQAELDERLERFQRAQSDEDPVHLDDWR